jgi:hypothetical protein
MSLSNCPNWLPLPTLLQVSVSPGTKGEATLACGRGGGGANSDNWRESPALCILYGLLYRKFFVDLKSWRIFKAKSPIIAMTLK